MIEAALRGEFDVVVVRDLSRFGRDILKAFDRLVRLHEAGVAIWLVDKGAAEPSPNSCRRMRAGEFATGDGRLGPPVNHVAIYLGASSGRAKSSD